MNDQINNKPDLPDRLSVDPSSPHHVAAVFEHEVGIRFNGKERSDVEEYCRSEGWIKVQAGKAVDRKGRPLCIKLKGEVEAFYR
jgi:predicted house-cleaning NTP pyrophosphatase (Maf/HAM1 superfamily)